MGHLAARGACVGLLLLAALFLGLRYAVPFDVRYKFSAPPRANLYELLCFLCVSGAGIIAVSPYMRSRQRARS